MKKILSLILSVLFILTAFTGCSVKGEPPKKADGEEETALSYEHETQIEEKGEVQSFKALSEKYSYTVYYPALNKTQIDENIKNFAKGLCEEFEKSTRGVNPQDNKKMTLFADYRINTIKQNDEDTVFSIVFRIITDNPYFKEHKDEIRTFNFDAKTQSAIEIDDVLKSEKQSEILNMIKEKMQIDAPLSKESLKNFSFSNTELIFFFDSNTVIESSTEYTEIAFKYEEISEMLSKKYSKLILNMDEEETENQAENKQEINFPQKNSNKKPESIPAFVPKPDKAPKGTKYIAVTFDDGPSEKITARILDILEKYNCKATFFVLGDRMEYSGYTKNLKRAYKMGCEIGNHGFSHSNLAKLSKEERAKQINDTDAKVKSVIGAEPTLFRPPYGDYKSYASEVEKPIVMWNIDTNDWRYKDKQNVPRSPAQRARDMNIILSSVVDNVDNGDIILMHDIYDMTADAFEQMLPILLKRNYKLVTVSELYRIKDEKMENGKIYRGF